LAGGIPLGFRLEGSRDVIIHWQTGYLARHFDGNDLLSAIRWVLEDGNAICSSAVKPAQGPQSDSQIGQMAVPMLSFKERACLALDVERVWQFFTFRGSRPNRIANAT
jgi:hypothetical protein